MDEFELVIEVEYRINNLFRRIESCEVTSMNRENVISGRRVDLDVNLLRKGRSYRVLVEIKSAGSPRILRNAAAQLKSLRKSIPNESDVYLMLAAPYISDDGMAICKEEGVGCFDLAGNCYLSFDSLYVEIRGNKNPLPSTRSIKSLFSPKSSRITRVLLSDVRKWWKVQELAKEAKVSLGLVSVIKQRLLDEELITAEKTFPSTILETKKSVQVKSPKRLLDMWTDNYSFRKNRIQEYYSLDNGTDIEERMQAYCDGQSIRCALGLFSGASRSAPFIRFNKSFMYVDAKLDAVAAANGLKPVPSGANVALLMPYDESVFYRSREIDGLKVVSDIQLYVDLKTYKGRGDEAAEFLFENKIKPQWQ
jgi:hypothetical protein